MTDEQELKIILARVIELEEHRNNLLLENMKLKKELRDDWFYRLCCRRVPGDPRNAKNDDRPPYAAQD